MSRLKPCPFSPNCVSSLESGFVHGVKPLTVPGERDAAMATLRQTLEAMERVEIQAEEEGYIHAVFTSERFGFKDDLELEWASEGVVHVRSASRKGFYDMGANRKRVKALRKLLG